MTIDEVLTRVKRDRPGESTDAEMIQWLSQLDGKWYDEIIMTHRLDQADDREYPWRYPVRLTRAEGTVCGATVSGNGDTVTINGTSTTPGGGYGATTVSYQHVLLEKGQQVRVGLELVSGSVTGESVSYQCALTLSCEDENATELWHKTVKVGEHAIQSVEETGNCYLTINMGAYGAVYTNYTLRCTLELATPAVTGFSGYASSVDRDTMLLIKEPDDEVYIHWLYAKIDYRLGELERYNVDAQLYNQAWNEAAKRYNRHNMPLGRIVHHVAYGRPVPWWGDEDPLNQRTRGAW